LQWVHAAVDIRYLYWGGPRQTTKITRGGYWRLFEIVGSNIVTGNEDGIASGFAERRDTGRDRVADH